MQANSASQTCSDSRGSWSCIHVDFPHINKTDWSLELVSQPSLRHPSPPPPANRSAQLRFVYTGNAISITIKPGMIKDDAGNLNVVSNTVAFSLGDAHNAGSSGYFQGVGIAWGEEVCVTPQDLVPILAECPTTSATWSEGGLQYSPVSARALTMNSTIFYTPGTLAVVQGIGRSARESKSSPLPKPLSSNIVQYIVHSIYYVVHSA